MPLTRITCCGTGLKALVDPEWFEKKGRLLPKPARAPPKLEGRFDVQGSLPPNLTVPSRSPPASDSQVSPTS